LSLVSRKTISKPTMKKYTPLSMRCKRLAKPRDIYPNHCASVTPKWYWDDIVGMRDIVIHEYFGVDLDIIWRTIQKDLTPLELVVKKMLSDLAED
jgi:hypothetical protein